MNKYNKLELDKEITVGEVHISLEKIPEELFLNDEVGLLTANGVRGEVIHRTPNPEITLFETRATITPKGDYLVMFPEGKHYNTSEEKVNEMLAYRSKDKGKTWEGPTTPFDIDFSQHGFIPLIPKGTNRIYCFGTQPLRGLFSTKTGTRENSPIGFRYSDDDGYTWSETTIIKPKNDPDFMGMSVMRMCETDDGTWLLGSHEGDWDVKPLQTRQYVLRSEDKGESWEVFPRPRQGGWYVKGFDRMDEGRPINLGNGKVFMLIRTPEGHYWSTRSFDDGKTWQEPTATTLIQPDAPCMLFHLSDNKTLVSLHHNRHHDTNYTGLSGDKLAPMKDRSEIWVAISKDEGYTWSEPRFLLANALKPNLNNPFRDYQCSYLDMFIDGDEVNIFVPHRWQQVVRLTFKEELFSKLPTKKDLGEMING